MGMSAPLEADYLVIGSGIAGLHFANQASAHGRVIVVTKKAPNDTNTNWAQGGVAAVLSREDSFEQHVQDTLVAGEPHAEIEEALHLRRAFLHAHLDDVAIAQPVACGQRVLDVELEGIIGCEHRCHAALRPVRVGVVGKLLRDDDDSPVLGGE